MWKIVQIQGPKFLFFFVQIAALTVIMQYFWEYDVIYSNSQWRTRKRKINGSAKFSETKVQKLCVVTFIIDWNLARYLGKTYCVQKCKKWIWSFVHHNILERLGFENIAVCSIHQWTKTPDFPIPKKKYLITRQFCLLG